MQCRTVRFFFGGDKCNVGRSVFFWGVASAMSEGPCFFLGGERGVDKCNVGRSVFCILVTSAMSDGPFFMVTSAMSDGPFFFFW